VDDLLDFTASSEQLGKPVLSDLKEGKVTLPLIFAMENGHREARDMVKRVLEEKEFHSVRPETIVALVRDSGALERTRNLAHDYARRAKACIASNADSEYARALLTLPDFILDREN
jgi:octaprenyl-diphosphate synthase